MGNEQSRVEGCGAPKEEQPQTRVSPNARGKVIKTERVPASSPPVKGSPKEQRRPPDLFPSYHAHGPKYEELRHDPSFPRSRGHRRSEWFGYGNEAFGDHRESRREVHLRPPSRRPDLFSTDEYGLGPSAGHHSLTSRSPRRESVRRARDRSTSPAPERRDPRSYRQRSQDALPGSFPGRYSGTQQADRLVHATSRTWRASNGIARRELQSPTAVSRFGSGMKGPSSDDASSGELGRSPTVRSSPADFDFSKVPKGPKKFSSATSHPAAMPPGSPTLPYLTEGQKTKPYIFISEENLPVKHSSVQHMLGWIRKFSVQTILIEPAGYYILFPENILGNTSAKACFHEKNGGVLFGQYVIHMELCLREEEASCDGMLVPAGRRLVDDDKLQLTSDARRPRPDNLGQSDSNGSNAKLDEQSTDVEQAGESTVDSGLTPAAMPTVQLPLESLRTRELMQSHPRIPADDEMSTSSVLAFSEISSSAVETTCVACKKTTSPVFNPIVKCKTCPRRFHESCRRPKLSPGMDRLAWQCVSCLKRPKSRSSFAPRSTSSDVPSVPTSTAFGPTNTSNATKTLSRVETEDKLFNAEKQVADRRASSTDSDPERRALLKSPNPSETFRTVVNHKSVLQSQKKCTICGRQIFNAHKSLCASCSKQPAVNTGAPQLDDSTVSEDHGSPATLTPLGHHKKTEKSSWIFNPNSTAGGLHNRTTKKIVRKPEEHRATPTPDWSSGSVNAICDPTTLANRDGASQDGDLAQNAATPTHIDQDSETKRKVGSKTPVVTGSPTQNLPTRVASGAQNADDDALMLDSTTTTVPPVEARTDIGTEREPIHTVFTAHRGTDEGLQTLTLNQLRPDVLTDHVTSTDVDMQQESVHQTQAPAEENEVVMQDIQEDCNDETELGVDTIVQSIRKDIVMEDNSVEPIFNHELDVNSQLQAASEADDFVPEHPVDDEDDSYSPKSRETSSGDDDTEPELDTIHVRPTIPRKSAAFRPTSKREPGGNLLRRLKNAIHKKSSEERHNFARLKRATDVIDKKGPQLGHFETAAPVFKEIRSQSPSPTPKRAASTNGSATYTPRSKSTAPGALLISPPKAWRPRSIATPYTHAQVIGMALAYHPQNSMSPTEIRTWVAINLPAWYRRGEGSWENSISATLAQNSLFTKHQMIDETKRQYTWKLPAARVQYFKDMFAAMPDVLAGNSTLRANPVNEAVKLAASRKSTKLTDDTSESDIPLAHKTPRPARKIEPTSKVSTPGGDRKSAMSESTNVLSQRTVPPAPLVSLRHETHAEYHPDIEGSDDEIQEELENPLLRASEPKKETLSLDFLDKFLADDPEHNAYTKKDLFKARPDYHPNNMWFDPAQKMKEIAARPPRKIDNASKKPLYHNRRLRPSYAPWKEIEPGDTKVKVQDLALEDSSDHEQAFSPTARTPRRNHTLSDYIAGEPRTYFSIEEALDLPEKMVPELVDGQLAYRELKMDGRSGRAVFKVGKDRNGHLDDGDAR
ncbi:hypothetical protein K402DRAFT_389141 [Aulographum hederae CBS 113979]|uniref:Fork-head domain-containing protein n=1 Tax=Aulographum hederae CBS 113979 TaxID=1176131 RepID=A0A6G1HCI1_9PEZI|nr:hypothetical protein K402DRAFT_389141 [Aulographum hederae CBS 113979]